MGITKKNIFNPAQNKMADMFKALAHPARLAIVEYLSQVDSCICGKIVDKIKLAQPTISQHLKELKRVGLIKGEVSGNTICYCLEITNLQKIEKYINLLPKKNIKPKPLCKTKGTIYG